MGDKYPKFKVAAVQASAILLDREATVSKACSLIEEAGKAGAKVIVFPEYYIPGPPVWYKFFSNGMGVNPDIAGFNRELFKNAVEIPSKATDALAEAAKAVQAVVVMGVHEKDPDTYGTLYNSIIFFGPNGEILGKRRKIIPTAEERLIHKGGDGSGLRVYKTPYGVVGGLMCGENTNSLARYSLLAQGETIHAALWTEFALTREQGIIEGINIRVKYYAYEGKIYVISSTNVFSNEMKDILGLTSEQRALFGGDGGNSGIVAPNGRYIAGPLNEGEGILYADVDYDAIIDGKFLHDIIGHYNRFDIFNLTVNRKENKSINFLDEEEQEEDLKQKNSDEKVQE